MRNVSKKPSKHNPATVRSNSSPLGATTKDLVASMRPPLRKEYTRIKHILTAVTSKGIVARHQAALIVVEVKQKPSRYGGGAITQLEVALGFDSKSLYRWAVVAETWATRASIEKVISRKNSLGLPLTWSHLELLATIRDRKRLTEMTDKTLTRALSVRQLSKLLSGKGDSPDEPRSPQASAAVDPAITALTRQVEDTDWDLGRWTSALARIPAGPPEPGLATALKQALDVHSRLKQRCEENIGALTSILARPQPVALPPAGPTVPPPQAPLVAAA